MDAVHHHCTRPFEQFATVPMGTMMGHIKWGEHEFLLSRLVPGLRDYLSQSVPVKNLDFLVYDEKWVEALSHGADEVIR